MNLLLEHILSYSETTYNSRSQIPWKKIREGETIRHEGVTYEIVFKVVRKSVISRVVIESNQLLYLRSLSDDENILGEIGINIIGKIDYDGHFSFLISDRRTLIPSGERPPETGLGYESWTKEDLDFLRKKLNAKNKQIMDILYDITK